MNTEQLALGEKLRDEGIKTVISHNECYKVRFHDAAMRILNAEGCVDSEAVVAVVGMPEGHRNAVGGSMFGFARAMKLSAVGYKKSSRPNRHSGVIAIFGRT